MLEKDSEGIAYGNAHYEWGQFDPEAYFQQYYGEPHADDDRVACLTVDVLKRALPEGNELEVVDVGTGPNLIPFFCAAPRARRLTAWEFAESNIAWLEAELKGSALRPQWQHFWGTVRSAYGAGWSLPDDPLPALRERCAITQGSIFDLPPRTWDAATMFFCAESITKRDDEFDAACTAFARCVRSGGTVAAAFLVSSEGYVVADHEFPALRLSAEAIEAVFKPHLDEIVVTPIGIVDREIRSGYSGQVFLSGKVR
ncbi:hypothetical protein [uncultured Hyphomicrobium sp.]|uniref:hypothetical protein n=1 Tax=uncultured Hyphomicrobium sp. TaxID=194373 RepID=UPI0026005F8C|nr:hypothetical protein [uncultured Hyphomicrobium sp.]